MPKLYFLLALVLLVWACLRFISGDTENGFWLIIGAVVMVNFGVVSLFAKAMSPLEKSRHRLDPIQDQQAETEVDG